MTRKFTTILLLVFGGLSASLLAQTKGEVALTVKLISAECFEGCTYDFEDASTGEKIILSWNTKYDEQKHVNTFPGLGNESVKIMNLIERCAASSYDGTNSSYCKEVLGKTFTVKAVKKTREEEVETAPLTWEKTGKIVVYYEIKNIRAKNRKVDIKENYLGIYISENGEKTVIKSINGKLFCGKSENTDDLFEIKKTMSGLVDPKQFQYEKIYLDEKEMATVYAYGFQKVDDEIILTEVIMSRGWEEETKYKKVFK